MDKDKIDRKIEQVRNVQLAINPDFEFRPLGGSNCTTEDGKTQEDIIRSILGPNNSFVILPTGKGKSLCFQSVAMVCKGITLVISPLRALIRSQVKMFNRIYNNGEVTKILGGPIRAIYPGMNGNSISEVIDLLGDSKSGYRLLYLTPERFSQPKFMRAFTKAIGEKRFVISNVIVDEAHCLSQWGFDFRETYLPIGGFVKSLPKKPKIAAFTATATPRDARQICGLLDKQGAGWDCFEYYEYRDNLRVLFVQSSMNQDARLKKVCKILSQEEWRRKGYSVIIYCNYVSAVEQLYHDLCLYLNNEPDIDWAADIHPQFYHGQMNDAKREKVERAFVRGTCNVIIATKAFGMGIDKDNVGMIIHYDFPVSIEDYYQEIGRAGRNKRKVPMAKCYVFKSRELFAATADWLLESDMKASNVDSPIMSKMSRESLDDIRYYKYYRLAQIWKLLLFHDNSDSFQYLIPNYFKTGSIYNSSNRIDTIMEEMKEYYLEKVEETDDDYAFISDIFTKRTRDEAETIREIKTILKEVNELHINNTKIANIMRWHPDAYTLGEPCSLSIHEWKHENRLSTEKARSRDLYFTIFGKEKLSYFDLCVADAIYSIESNGCNIIYEKTILELLSGNPKATFSRDIRDASKSSEMNLKTMIVKSIEKMQQIRISIADSEGEMIHKECFLPICKRADTDPKQKGYSYDRVLPLYRYAESLNGELIRVPMTKMNDGKPASAWTIVQNHYRLHRSSIASYANRGVGIVPTTEFEIVKPYMPEYVKKKTEKAIRFFQERNLPVRNLEIHSFYDEVFGDCTWRALNRIACSCDLGGEHQSWMITCEKGDKDNSILNLLKIE